ncbi:catechol 1,2-dioxygenase, partial [Acinetobacter radioresistens]|nr:catechol 1,2-dioxygenase [Acinetobacter radioresistens]
ATRDGLVATATDVTDEAEIARRELEKPFKYITFNVELVKEAEAAPSSEVERRRAAA